MTLKILVVEDDFANQRVTCLFLKKLGYEVDIAEHGGIAIELALATPYLLIFMDCQMPIVDGFEATRKIRSTPGPNQKTPIIALTANVVCGVNSECIEAGMDDVLNKPIQLDSMKHMLVNWLETEN
jgi:CheY-like chemotaxis protein